MSEHGSFSNEPAKSARRHVAVLGPIPRDRIITHSGEIFEKYGCALYTVAALSALLDPDDRICPIVHVRREDEDAIKEMLSAFPNVDLTGIRSASDQGDVVELDYIDQNQPRSSGRPRSWTRSRLRTSSSCCDADAFVCVPITDYEVGQATLAYIKEHSAGTILLDAHGPTSTLVTGGERTRRLWVERDAWLPAHRHPQDEPGGGRLQLVPVAGRARAPRPRGHPSLEDSCPTSPSTACDRGVQAVCVTLDERGCVVYHRDSGGRAGGGAGRRGSWWTTSSTRPGAATRSPRAWRSATCRTATSCRRPRVRQRDGCAACQRLGPRRLPARWRRPTSRSPRAYGPRSR